MIRIRPVVLALHPKQMIVEITAFGKRPDRAFGKRSDRFPLAGRNRVTKPAARFTAAS